MPTSTTFWMNKRAVAVIDLPPHRFASEANGWSAEFTGPGTLVVRLLQGVEQRIDVKAGDILRASGEEFYLVKGA